MTTSPEEDLFVWAATRKPEDEKPPKPKRPPIQKRVHATPADNLRKDEETKGKKNPWWLTGQYS